jgi:Domain of unknown function (DUF1707)
MAGLEHEMAAGSGRGRLRASRADRERVIDTLKAAYAYGLVSKDEFDTRVSQTFASRTYAELAVITADIPPGLAPAPPALTPAPARASAPVAANVTAADRAVMATAIVAGVAIVASVFAGVLAGLLVLGGVGSAFVSGFLFVKQMRSQRAKHPGGQLPPQPGVDPGPSAAHRAICATPAERLPDAGKPRRHSKADAARRQFSRPVTARAGALKIKMMVALSR